MGTREGSERSGSLDIFRAVWACGIVQFHLGESFRAIAYGALPAFLIVLLQLSQGSATRHSFPEFARRRAARLLVPWLIWSVAYALVQVLASLDSDPLEWFKRYMLLYGPSIHLWFLPAAFLLSCLFVPMARLKTGHAIAALVLAAVGAAAAFALMIAGYDTGLPTPIDQWRFALPSLFLAALLPSVVREHPDSERSALEHLGWVVAGVILAGALVLTGAPLDKISAAEATTYIVGVATLLAARYIRIPSTPFIRALGSASFLVYLIHPLVGRVIGRIIKSYHSDLLAILTMVASLVAAVAINAAFARYAGRFARLAPYIGAEARDVRGERAGGDASATQ